MNRLVLGVVGHVDHGKTALVGALTGMQTDRLAEEQARGISIALGFAHMTAGGAAVDLIDMPGHERFVRTMVSGATGMDAVLLVVDAARGVMPQTREHFDIAALLGVRRAVIAVSRADLAAAAAAEATVAQTAALVADAGILAAPPVVCSAHSGLGLPALVEAIAALAQAAAPHADDGAPYLAVDRAFSVAGHGTVVTGTLRGGRLATGETVAVVPDGPAVRIRALQVHGRRVAMAEPGQRVAVNLRDVEAGGVRRGAALASVGAMAASTWMSVQLHLVADAPPLATGNVLRLLAGTLETDVRVRLLEDDTLEPGRTAFAQLHAATPVAVPARARFVLRGGNPVRTLAGGAVLDPQAVRARRRSPSGLRWLAGLADAAPGAIVTAELARAGGAGTTLARLSRLAGVGHAQAAALLGAQGAVLARGGEAIAAAAFAALMARLHRAVAALPDGAAQARLAALSPDTPVALLDEATRRLLTACLLWRDGAVLRVHRPGQDEARARAVQAASTRIADTLRLAGLTPPDPQTLTPDVTSRRLLEGLVRAGVVVRAPDRVQKRDILFHRDAIEAARRRLTTLLGQDGLLVSEIGAALGISRKYSVPLLEHLDSVQFTRRVSERRVLATGRAAGVGSGGGD